MFMTIIICAGQSSVIPVMPIIMKEYGAGAGFLTASFVGLLVGRLVASIFTGYVLLRIKAYQLLFLAFILHIITMFLLIHAENGLQFCALRFMEGIFEGMASVILQDIVVGLSEPEDRGVKMGYMQAAFGIGFIVGPLATSIAMFKFGATGVFGLVIIFMIICTIWLSIIYKELSVDIKSHPPQRIVFDLEFIKYLPYYCGPIMQRVLFVSFAILLPLFLVDSFQLLPHQVAYFYLGSAIMTSVTLPISGRLAKKSYCTKLVFGAMALMGVTIIGMGFSKSIYMFIFVYALETIGFILMAPNAMKIFADHVSDHPRRSEIIGTSSSFREVANIVVVLTIVPLYEYSWIAPWLVLGIACIIFGLPYIFKELKINQF